MISDLLQWLLQILGLGKGENQAKIGKYAALKSQLLSQKTAKHDEIADLRESLSALERTILAKEREREAARGENRSIIEREIAQLFFEQDSKKGLQNALFQALEHSTTMIAKVEELLSNLKAQKFDPNIVDLLTEDLIETLQVAKEKEKAISDLRRSTVYTPQSAAAQYNPARVAELRGETNAVPQPTQHVAPQVTAATPAATNTVHETPQTELEELA